MSKKLANQLLEIEEHLNKQEYVGVQTGVLLAKLNLKIYFKIFKKSSIFKNIGKFFYLVLSGLFSKKLLLSPNKRDSELMFSKLADKPQCNKLIDPLHYHFTGSILWKYYESGDIGNIKGVKKVNVFELPKIVFKSILLASNAKHYYSKFPEVTFWDIYIIYFSAIVQLNNWITFFNNSNIRLLVVDFDRDNKSPSMILAAKKCGIKTLTLVHGVMDPSYGFYPVIADKILVWGELQKKYLLNGGVSSKKIHIVGNPISEKYKQSATTSKTETLRQIGVALNNKGDSHNKALLENISDYTNKNSDVEFIIKLHPSMKMTDWMFKMQSEHLKFYSFNKLTIQDFFNKIETLIVGNSGIGYEAVVNDIPVAVINLNSAGKDNDFVMVNEGGFPDVTSNDILCQFLIDMKVKSKRDLLLENEKQFVLGKYYSAIGNDAINNAIKIINEKTNS